MRTIITLTAAFAALHAGVTGQQRADVEFDARVSRPAFAMDGPSVLIDGGHHNFHTAAGRYKPFADLIANDGFRVASGQQPFTRQLLSEYRILVVSNALHRDSAGLREFSAPWVEAGGKPAFGDDECDVVQAWVERGGSLLLVADHRPFGAAAASLAGRFGVDMAKGYVFDTKNTDKDGNYRSVLLFSRDNGGLGDHPIFLGREPAERVNRVMTFVGQSLTSTHGVQLLVLSPTAIDKADLRSSTPETSAHGRAQAIALKVGAGRVVVLAEAAMITAQGAGASRMGMNVEGNDNKQFALNVMRWLGGVLEPAR